MNKLLLVFMAVLISGCASREDLLKEPSAFSFDSSKSAGSLAVCIDRNADSAVFSNLRSKITNVDGEPIEVLIRRGDEIHVVVQIKPTPPGSHAEFYFGVSGYQPTDFAINTLIKDCK